jgi:hypothetical protein
MAQYKGTFECGHEGWVNIIGPSKQRQWKLERAFDRDCDECQTKKYLERIEREKKEAEEKAKEMELPKLSGTEKQVSWANTIRQKWIDYLTDKIIYIDKEESRFHICNEEDNYFEDMKELNYIELIDFIIKNYISAKFYIDNRDLSTRSISELFYKDMQNAKKENKIEKEIEKEIETELTAYPKQNESLEPVILEMKENKITAKYSKDDTFKEIIKSKDFCWDWSNYTWELIINSKNGTIEDRIIEVGNKLLNAGFPVKFDSSELKEKAIKGEYKEETTRWICLMKDGQLGIWFKYRDDKLYKSARTIKSSKWSNPYITVKIEHFEELLDYAQLYNFEIKENAMEAIEKFRESIEKIETVNPETKNTSNKEVNKLEEILNSKDDILDDLKD